MLLFKGSDKMKKPEKKETSLNKGGCESFYTGSYEEGYNQACEDWEKYHAEFFLKTLQGGNTYVLKESLPSEDEIYKILDKEIWCKAGRDYTSELVRRLGNEKAAKAIHERLLSGKKKG